MRTFAFRNMCTTDTTIKNKIFYTYMKKYFIILFFSVLCCQCALAQDANKSELQQRAEEEFSKSHPITARSLYVRAFEDYFAKGQMTKGIECITLAADLYCKENSYPEAFEVLNVADKAINEKDADDKAKASAHYLVSKHRMTMFTRIHRPQSALDHVAVMERYAQQSGDESLVNDALYHKAICYYNQGQTAKGNQVFEQMASKLTSSGEYDKVEKVYQTLIDNSRKSGNASLLAQTYKKYVAWKDSADAMKHADEIGALKKQIADNEAAISEKDSSLTMRSAMIVGLCVLAAALAVALVVGAVILMRFILLTRKQKKTIQLANDNNALKAKFISNISAQLDPSLQKLDKTKPEVKALLDFSQHIQTLSALENSTEELQFEETLVHPFCEELMEQIRGKVAKDVTLTVNAPKMSVDIYQPYVSHILLHLLNNAAEYTPEGGTITLEYKKRGAHSHQFLVSNTGSFIDEEKRDDVFKAFREVRDLTKGDGLGLPTCKQMALKMNGDLEIAPDFVKGTRFVLELHS